MVKSRHRGKKDFNPASNGCSISLPGRGMEVMSKALAMLAGQDVTSIEVPRSSNGMLYCDSRVQDYGSFQEHRYVDEFVSP